MAGKWKIDGDRILLISPFGEVERCKLKDNNIVDSDGEV